MTANSLAIDELLAISADFLMTPLLQRQPLGEDDRSVEKSEYEE